MAVLAYGAFYRQSWLILKLIVLLVYIILGSFALRYGRTKPVRMISLAGAWLAFFGIIAIAMKRAFITI
jgi:uncharacterized membrane protein SirB2